MAVKKIVLESSEVSGANEKIFVKKVEKLKKCYFVKNWAYPWKSDYFSMKIGRKSKFLNVEGI